MQHLPEVLKIVEGGIKRDDAKVLRYVDLLCSKLEVEGDVSSAQLLRKTIDKIKPNALRPAGLDEKALIPVDAESRVSIADVSYPTVEEAPLVLDSEGHRVLEDFVTAYVRRDDLLSAGIPGPGHILLHGPPGCGKTQAAKYLAGRLSLPLVTARLDGVISSFLGSTAKNLRALFEFVDRMPCVLLLDEFDALAKMRDDPHELGELKRVVNSLLQNIDLLPAGTVVVAATNHAHLLDPAVWRRFESQVSISPPDETARRLLLDLYLPRHKLTTAELEAIVKITERFTAADIKAVCDLMARELVLARAKAVELAHAAQAILAFGKRNGATHADRQWPDKIDDRIRDLRSRDASLFTYDVISRLLQVSKGKISNVLRESQGTHARE